MRLLVLSGLLTPAAAWGATLDVCTSCTYTSVQDAADAASSGDVVRIAAGRWSTADVAGIDLTLQGAGAGVTYLVGDEVLDLTSGTFVVEDMTLSATSSRSIDVRYATLTLSGVEVTGGSAVTGAGLRLRDSTGSIVDSSFHANDAGTGASGHRGGHVYARNATLDIDNSTFTDGLALEGGAIYVNATTLTVTDCTLHGNQTIGHSSWSGGEEARGGALRAVSGSDVTVSTSTLSGNSATTNADGGGAISLDGSSLYLVDSTLSGNSTSGPGGALWSSDAYLELTRTDLSGNSALDGGGVYLDDDSWALVTSGTWSGNATTGGGWTSGGGGGGGGYVDGGGIEVSGAALTGNTATGNGGGLFLTGDSWSSVASTAFTANRGDYGGAVFLGGSAELELDTCGFTENAATSNGGAIRWNPNRRSGYLQVTSSVFSENTADWYGGAIAANKGEWFESVDSAYIENEASYGGAVSLYQVDGISAERNVLCGNAADDEGGAVRLNDTGDDWDTWTANVWAHNTSAAAGGGVWVASDTPSAWFAYNDFLGNQAASGGGVYTEASMGFSSNLVAWSTGAGVHSTTANTLQYSAFWSNATTDVSGSATAGTGTVTADPRLSSFTPGRCDTLDWRPLADSPLIDAGDPSVNDLDGSRSDIGAYGGPDADPDAWLDADGDGFPWVYDCDDADATVNPGATETYYDGLDQDCDGRSDYDADQDGHDSDAWGGDDCDDANAAISPSATEVWYDGVDQDCDGGSDYDADGDGLDSDAYGGTDCDDTDSTVHPGATEVWYDGVDQDCDGGSDYDADGDGYDSDAYGGTDCDDTDLDISPSGVEVCDNADNDCNGTIDDDATDAPTWYADADGDGFGTATAASTITACDQPAGFAATDDDCDDTAASVYPGADETCNGIDDDCDTEVDEAGAVDGTPYYPDADGDGFGDLAASPTGYCSSPGDGWSDTNSDCDDTDAGINPDADEVCGGADEDCDGTVDEADAIDATLWYQDTDGDGYGTVSIMATACDQPDGFAPTADDCDDTVDTIHPGADEFCNSVDDDCDTDVDEDAVDAPIWYTDADGDGYGDPGAATAECEAPVGTVSDNQDCDDSTDTVHPSADEYCNAVDDDCDTEVDEDAVDALTWYLDGDGDGYGHDDATATACEAPAGYVADGGDCDDTQDDWHPGAAESCDEPYEDTNCDGSVGDDDADGDGSIACEDCNDADADINPNADEIWYDGVDQDCDGGSDYDADQDGWDAADYEGADCDDSDGAVNPDAEEIWYDDVDQDCDGGSDYDADGDGYDTLASGGLDCDDTNQDISPDGSEIPDDGIDQDCDGEDLVTDMGEEDVDIKAGGCSCSTQPTSTSGLWLLGLLGLLGLRRR